MPLTGFMQNAVCYGTYDEAMSVKFGNDPVLITAATKMDKLHFFEVFNGVWHWSEYTTQGGAWTLAYHSIMPAVGFPACDPAPYQFLPPTPADIAFVFSWGFGAVMLFFFFGFVIGTASKVVGKV